MGIVLRLAIAMGATTDGVTPAAYPIQVVQPSRPDIVLANRHVTALANGLELVRVASSIF